MSTKTSERVKPKAYTLKQIRNAFNKSSFKDSWGMWVVDYVALAGELRYRTPRMIPIGSPMKGFI